MSLVPHGMPVRIDAHGEAQSERRTQARQLIDASRDVLRALDPADLRLAQAGHPGHVGLTDAGGAPFITQLAGEGIHERVRLLAPTIAGATSGGHAYSLCMRSCLALRRAYYQMSPSHDRRTP